MFNKSLVNYFWTKILIGTIRSIGSINTTSAVEVTAWIKLVLIGVTHRFDKQQYSTRQEIISTLKSRNQVNTSIYVQVVRYLINYLEITFEIKYYEVQ